MTGERMQYPTPRGAYQKTFGQMSEVRRLRMARYLTQADLARMVGCSERAVREHERLRWPDAKAVGRALHRRMLQVLRDL